MPREKKAEDRAARYGFFANIIIRYPGEKPFYCGIDAVCEPFLCCALFFIPIKKIAGVIHP